MWNAATAVITAALGEIAPRVLIATVAAVALPVGGYVWGHIDAAASCRAHALADALAGAEHNIKTLNAAANDTAARTISLEALNGSLRAKVTDYEKQLANPVAPAPAVCRLTDDDARRLRELSPGGAARPR